ncbi:hypothetical protein GYB59_00545 [bacterium]|nr:hypothetical protein [bacterium]
MHHLIFIPGKPDLASSLVDVGLANHVDGASFTPADKGPDDQRGCMVSWRGVQPVYDPAEQEWIPAVPWGGYEAKRYWIGIDREKPPEPRDLLRASPIHGAAVRFADGEYWTLPPVQQLPTQIVLDDSGKYVGQIKQEFQHYYVEVMRQIAKIGDDLTGEFLLDDLIAVIQMGLSFNYHLPRELTARLGLLGSDELQEAFFAICGLQRK